jgi:hypothetical protein
LLRERERERERVSVRLKALRSLSCGCGKNGVKEDLFAYGLLQKLRAQSPWSVMYLANRAASLPCVACCPVRLRTVSHIQQVI